MSSDDPWRAAQVAAQMSVSTLRDVFQVTMPATLAYQAFSQDDGEPLRLDELEIMPLSEGH